jgi:hypothetical protein
VTRRNASAYASRVIRSTSMRVRSIFHKTRRLMRTSGLIFPLRRARPPYARAGRTHARSAAAAGVPGPVGGASALLQSRAAWLRSCRAKFRIQADNKCKAYFYCNPLYFRINDAG